MFEIIQYDEKCWKNLPEIIKIKIRKPDNKWIEHKKENKKPFKKIRYCLIL